MWHYPLTNQSIMQLFNKLYMKNTNIIKNKRNYLINVDHISFKELDGFQYFKSNCILAKSLFCNSLGISLVDAYNAAPAATAVIGSMLVFTFFES